MKVQRWIYSQRPETEVSEAHYELQELVFNESPQRGEVLIEADYWSVDPYMRIGQSKNFTWDIPHAIGCVQSAGVVGRVIKAGNNADGFAVGDYVYAPLGWQTHGICRTVDCRKLDQNLAEPHMALHVLGMTGLTAFHGLLDLGRPKAGDSLLVSGAAGAVGHLVGQIGKLAGCRVVGVVGSEKKAKFITEDLGFDAAINYRAATSQEKAVSLIRAAAPDGIDVYFDNTGGVITDGVLETMNVKARIVICGQISQYQGSLDTPSLGPRMLHHMLYKRATMMGFLARDYKLRSDEAVAKMSGWMRTGDINAHVTVWDGFDRLPSALVGLFEGRNSGKLIVKKC